MKSKVQREDRRVVSPRDKQVNQWKILFLRTLHGAMNPPTSTALAASTRASLTSGATSGGAVGEKPAKVSRALVEKWRSKKSSVVPVRGEVANGLVDALEELGIFKSRDLKIRSETGGALPDDAAEQLVTLLDFRRRPTARAAMNAAHRRALDHVSKQLVAAAKGTEGLTDSELVTACACAVSQESLQHADLLRAGDDLVIVLAWEPSTAQEAYGTLGALVGELDSPTTSKYLRQLLEQTVTIHVFLHVLGTMNPGQMGPGEPERAINAFLAFITTKRLKPHVLEKREVAPSFLRSDNFWLQLHSDGSSDAWRLVRHPTLFKKLQLSRATTFCSPLTAEECKKLLEILEIHRDVQGKHWIVPQDDERPNTNSQAEKSSRKRARAASHAKS
jgi:hypothetical protein